VTLLLVKYDPDQPRDSDGRWGEGGGLKTGDSTVDNWKMGDAPPKTHGELATAWAHSVGMTSPDTIGAVADHYLSGTKLDPVFTNPDTAPYATVDIRYGQRLATELANAKPDAPTLYRGIAVSPSKFDMPKVGDVIHMAPGSWSGRQDVAQFFSAMRQGEGAEMKVGFTLAPGARATELFPGGLKPYDITEQRFFEQRGLMGVHDANEWVTGGNFRVTGVTGHQVNLEAA
jgi:hypothetical protein